MSDDISDEEPEITREGLFEVIAGRAKEAAGTLLGNEELTDAGRREQAHAGDNPDAPSDTPDATDDRPSRGSPSSA